MFSDFEKEIKIIFKNKKLLKQAFIHRSYLNENPNINLPHNERLEFLGDAVLELVVTEYLYHKFPNYQEGELTSYRSALVNTITLSKGAVLLGIEKYLLLSKGEAKSVGKGRQCILANAFEALIGAIYLDQGFLKAKNFIIKNLIEKNLDEIIRKKLWKDAKSFVQEKAQEEINITPHYEVLREYGPDHNKTFSIGIYFGEKLIAEATGKSKREAEQRAAEKALKIMKWER